MKQDGSVVPPIQDSFVLVCHAVNILAAYRRWGITAEEVFAAFVDLVGARDKQVTAECLMLLEEAILALDDEPVGSP